MELKLHQRNSDKNNTEIYKKAIQFFIDKLLPKYKQKRLKVSIIFKKFRGACSLESGSCEQISRNRYKIEINKIKPFHKIISTLAHELCHVKQGVNGKLIMTTEGFKWNGKLYKSVDIPDERNEELPFEKEAYSLEKVLTPEFFNTIILPDIKTQK